MVAERAWRLPLKMATAAIVLLVSVARGAKTKDRGDHVRHVGDEVVFIGCFAELPLDSGEHDIPGWQQSVVRPKTNTEGCAARCIHSTYFALQKGVCQCTSSFGSTPNTQNLRDPAECGPPCAGEESLQPPRWCGASDDDIKQRNAVYTRTRCALGARFLADKQLDNDRLGIKQWQAKLVFDEWEVGARVVLDWGDVANEVYSLWNAVFAEKEGVRGPRVEIVLKSSSPLEIGMKMRGTPFAIPRLHCTARPRPPPPMPHPPFPPSPPRPPSPPPAPPACEGAVLSVVQRFASGNSYAAEVYVKQWHLGHLITIEFGAPTEVYAVWSAEIAGATPDSATFRLPAQYGNKFRFHAQGRVAAQACIPCPGVVTTCNRPPPPPPRARLEDSR